MGYRGGRHREGDWAPADRVSHMQEREGNRADSEDNGERQPGARVLQVSQKCARGKGFPCSILNFSWFWFWFWVWLKNPNCWAFCRWLVDVGSMNFRKRT